MNPEGLIKYGVKKALQSHIPQPPGSKPVTTVTQSQSSSDTSSKHRKWWRGKKDNPYAILTPHEQKVLKKVKARAHTLDKGFNCCCCQVGLDPILGLIPVIGDFLGFILALNVIHLAMQVDLPRAIYSQMLVNIVWDMLLGFIPIVGDLMDFMFKCNTRNALLLEQFLLERRRNELKKAGQQPPIETLTINDSSNHRGKST